MFLYYTTNPVIVGGSTVSSNVQVGLATLGSVFDRGPEAAVGEIGFDQEYSYNTAFGMWFGATLALTIAYIFDSSIAPEAKRNLTYLVTASVTLLSAGIALGGVYSNQKLQKELDEQKLVRKSDSARALLPSALSQLMDVARSGLRHNAVLSGSGEISVFVGKPDSSALRLSDEIVFVFRDLIENSIDRAVREHLLEILREHQVLVARSAGGKQQSRRATPEDYRHVAHWA